MRGQLPPVPQTRRWPSTPVRSLWDWSS